MTPPRGRVAPGGRRRASAEYQLTHIRLPRELIRKIDHAAIDSGLLREEVIEALIHIELKRRSALTPGAA